MNYLKTLDLTQNTERGWVLFPFEDGQILSGNVKNVHLVSIEPSEIRGNHYHMNKTEFLYIFGGRVLIAVLDLNLDEKILYEEIDCSKFPVLLEASPKVAHAIKNIGESLVYLFCYGTESYDMQQPDVRRKEILT